MEKLKYTKVCLSCGLVLADSSKFCNKCGNFVETARCPVCRKATNPKEALCNNCNSNISDLVKTDLDKSAAVLRLLQKNKCFEDIQPIEQMLRLASQDSIIGLAGVYAFENAAKREGTYKSRFTLFVYDEASPDDWDKPSSFFNPREKYASKLEYLEAIRKDSKRPDFGFFSWATIYAKTGKDIFAYRLCLMLSNLYTFMSDLFDNAIYCISEVGVELQHQAYELLCIAQRNPQFDYSQDDVAKRLFSNVRYKLARQYFFIQYLELNKPDENGEISNLTKYYSHFDNGYKRALDVLNFPLPEDQTPARLLRGLLQYNYNNVSAFLDAWNNACDDTDYINSEKSFIDDNIFSTAAICISSIVREDGDMNSAINILKFAFSHITRKACAENLQAEFSKYQQDAYGNILYRE